MVPGKGLENIRPGDWKKIVVSGKGLEEIVISEKGVGKIVISGKGLEKMQSLEIIASLIFYRLCIFPGPPSVQPLRLAYFFSRLCIF